MPLPLSLALQIFVLFFLVLDFFGYFSLVYFLFTWVLALSMNILIKNKLKLDGFYSSVEYENHLTELIKRTQLPIPRFGTNYAT
jgi:hypothetical protein